MSNVEMTGAHYSVRQFSCWAMLLVKKFNHHVSSLSALRSFGNHCHKLVFLCTKLSLRVFSINPINKEMRFLQALLGNKIEYNSFNYI